MERDDWIKQQFDRQLDAIEALKEEITKLRVDNGIIKTKLATYSMAFGLIAGGVGTFLEHVIFKSHP